MKAETIGLQEHELREILDILQSIPSVEQAILYGSRAKGNYKRFSDLDITLIGENLNSSDLAELEDKLYYTYLPYTFDLSIFSQLRNPELIDHINRAGIRLL